MPGLAATRFYRSTMVGAHPTAVPTPTRFSAILFTIEASDLSIPAAVAGPAAAEQLPVEIPVADRAE